MLYASVAIISRHCRLRATGQPVLIGGSMGTESWVLAAECAGLAKRVARLHPVIVIKG